MKVSYYYDYLYVIKKNWYVCYTPMLVIRLTQDYDYIYVLKGKFYIITNLHLNMHVKKVWYTESFI
jgi:hypothetical protein